MAHRSMDDDLECDSAADFGFTDDSFRLDIVAIDRDFRKIKMQGNNTPSVDSAYSSSQSAASFASSIDLDDKISVSSFPETRSDLRCIPEIDVDECLEPPSLAPDSPQEPNNLLQHQDEEGDSLLHLSIIGGKAQIAEDCIRGANFLDSLEFLNVQNNFFQTPLHLAVITKQIRIVDMLLQSHAAIDIPDYYGNTPLHIACREGDQDIAELILRYNSHHTLLNLKNYDGLTCLHICALQKHYNLIILLCGKGANINIQDGKSGRTVLHYAAEHGDMSLVNLLFNYPTLDINATTYSGMSAVYLAEGRSHNQIKQLLQLNGAAITEYSSDESEDDTSIADDFCINGQPI